MDKRWNIQHVKQQNELRLQTSIFDKQVMVPVFLIEEINPRNMRRLRHPSLYNTVTSDCSHKSLYH